MAKSTSRKDGSSKTTRASSAEGQTQKYDPALVSLFAQSLGAVKSDTRAGLWLESHPTTASAAEADKLSSSAVRGANGLLSETSMEQVHSSLSDDKDSRAIILINNVATRSSRNRKRKDAEDDLKTDYMNHLAREEVQKDQQRRRKFRNKRPKLDTQEDSNVDIGFLDEDGESTSDRDTMTGREDESAIGDIPQHESSVTSRADLNVEKSLRTVFLANVSTMAIKSRKARKILMDHLASFASSLPASDGRHAIESLRFRSTPFVASGLPKKAAFVKKNIMDTTTKSTNAYVVYATQLAARAAVLRLNGSIVLDRHLRVDSVAHPAKVDHRRCVFVGNLGFIDDETNVNAARDEEISKRPRKSKEPGDVEEGLWRQFKNAGIVESVRVVRDKTTRVGKGFAYIQFKDANSVEKALHYHEKKFPPMLPRVLRVTRAKNLKNTKSVANRKEGPFLQNAEPTKYRTKVPSQVQSLTGRARKLLGRAGAAKFRAIRGRHYSSSSVTGVAKSSESITFEGFRASSSQGKVTPRTAGRKHNKPSNRSKEFRMKGKKKTKL